MGVGSCQWFRSDGVVEYAVVTAEGFLGVGPFCVSNVFGEGKARTRVPSYGVTNARWMCRVGVKSQAQRGRKFRHLAPALLFTHVPPECAVSVEITHDHQRVPARSLQGPTEEGFESYIFELGRTIDVEYM